MTRQKSRQRKVPEDFYQKIDSFGNMFKVPNTRAFILRDKILLGNFKAKKVKKKGKGKEVFEIEFL